MKILAFNTAGNDTQIAIINDDKVILKTAGFSRHSETLFPLLNEVLNDAKLTIADFDAFACVVGPGSFTGIRIGMSVAKGFAYSFNKPIIAITSLEILANSLKNISPICAVINAGSGLLYHQEFEVKNDTICPISQARVDKIRHFEGYIQSRFDANINFAYNSNNDNNETLSRLFEYERPYKIEDLIQLAKLKYEASEFKDAINVAPIYLRASQAEQEIKNFEFSKASVDDLKDILLLESQNDEWDLKWSETAFRQSFDNPNFECFIAKSHGEVKGHICISNVVDEAEILRVVVLNTARLGGIATKMFECLIDYLKKNDKKAILLEVNNHNYPAYNLYRKLGFIEVGCRKDYYGQNQDAILMKLDI